MFDDVVAGTCLPDVEQVAAEGQRQKHTQLTHMATQLVKTLVLFEVRTARDDNKAWFLGDKVQG